MKLMHELLKARVRPYYYIWRTRWQAGTLPHYRAEGLEIMQALRGWTSGLAFRSS